MTRRLLLALLGLSPALATVPPARAVYETPRLTRLPFTLPKPTGPTFPPRPVYHYFRIHHGNGQPPSEWRRLWDA